MEITCDDARVKLLKLYRQFKHDMTLALRIRRLILTWAIRKTLGKPAQQLKSLISLKHFIFYNHRFSTP